jgi:hypothetical protein
MMELSDPAGTMDLDLTLVREGMTETPLHNVWMVWFVLRSPEVPQRHDTTLQILPHS